MEVARLILEYCKTLAWPFVALFSLLFFKEEIRALGRSVQRLRLPGGAELEWQAKLEPLSLEQQRQRLLEDTGPSEVPVAVAAPPKQPSAKGTSEEPFPAAVQKALQAEDLVMRQLEAELGFPMKRQIMYKRRPDLAFDGFALVGKFPTLIEVKYVTSDSRIPALVNVFASHLQTIKADNPALPPRGILVLVADAPEDVRLRIETEARRIAGRKFDPPDVRVYDFAELKRGFGLNAG